MVPEHAVLTSRANFGSYRILIVHTRRLTRFRKVLLRKGTAWSTVREHTVHTSQQTPCTLSPLGDTPVFCDDCAQLHHPYVRHSLFSCVMTVNGLTAASRTRNVLLICSSIPAFHDSASAPSLPHPDLLYSTVPTSRIGPYSQQVSGGYQLCVQDHMFRMLFGTSHASRDCRR